MATIRLNFEMSGASDVIKTLTFSDTDAADILAAFKTSVSSSITDGDKLMSFFASNIMGQIQGVTQNYRAGQNPAPIPPVTLGP